MMTTERERPSLETMVERLVYWRDVILVDRHSAVTEHARSMCVAHPTIGHASADTLMETRATTHKKDLLSMLEGKHASARSSQRKCTTCA